MSDKSTADLKLIADLDDIDERDKQRAEIRRKAGRYNLEEAAKIIAQAAGAVYEAILAALVDSVESGTLSTYMPDNTAPIKYGSGQGKWPWADAYLDECYWDDLNEWLETKMKRVDYEFPNPADTSAAKVEAVAKGITKQQVITAFEGLHFNADQWGKYLASPPEWLANCRVMRGNKKTSALWNPALIATALLDKKITIKKLDAVFIRLSDWADEWQEKSDYQR